MAKIRIHTNAFPYPMPVTIVEAVVVDLIRVAVDAATGD
jgi:hypothetical protein